MADRLPELLAPAGSPAALRAALAAGADAVYFGGGSFNARMRAQNFTDADVKEAIDLCHTYGAKAYMTFNTLITDRELPLFLAAAEQAYRAGVDALIVADLGAAELLHRTLPDLPLHASTQCSAHSVDGVRELIRRGFCRVVPARELPAEEIAALVRQGGTEIEIFVHGALCVSHSGQCLFSSLVGGRSGNRGACAQPCRLPDAKGRYPLSLKDLCLAREIPFFIQTGVHSLKIEGRLKSPEYVYRVVSVYRRLLDEGRGATGQEMEQLAATFSRSGFTDAYFKNRIGGAMLGVRSDQDKAVSDRLPPLPPEALTPPPIPLSVDFEMRRGQPIRLTLQNGAKTATVWGDIPLVAQNAPMDEAAIQKNLCRFGGTPYVAHTVRIAADAGLMLPVSRLNALRRAALAELTAAKAPERGQKSPISAPALPVPSGERPTAPTARFEQPRQITQAAKNYFARRYLPLYCFTADAAAPALANGVILPPVLLEREIATARQHLQIARERGATYALVGNVGHLSLALEAGLIPYGDFRLNITNTLSLATALEQGFAAALLSPELSLPQIRDICGAADAIVYGRIPLMLLEKCAGREIGSCERCKEQKNALVDRRGEKFPLLRLCDPPEGGRHRNVLYNSRPTAMSDRRRDLRTAGITGGHFIFSVETPDEVDRVIRAYQNGTPLGDRVRRI